MHSPFSIFRVEKTGRLDLFQWLKPAMKLGCQLDKSYSTLLMGIVTQAALQEDK